MQAQNSLVVYWTSLLFVQQYNVFLRHCKLNLSFRSKFNGRIKSINQPHIIVTLAHCFQRFAISIFSLLYIYYNLLYLSNHICHAHDGWLLDYLGVYAYCCMNLLLFTVTECLISF